MEQALKNLSLTFLENFEDGKYALDDELQKQTKNHYNALDRTKKFLTDTFETLSKQSKNKKYVEHLIQMILETDNESQEKLKTENRLLKKQMKNLEQQIKLYKEGHTKSVCPICKCNIDEMVAKKTNEYIEKNNLQVYQDKISHQGEILSEYNQSVRKYEYLVETQKQQIQDLKYELMNEKQKDIEYQLEEKENKAKKNKKKKKKNQLSQKQMMKLLQQAIQAQSSSDEESSSSDEEY